jgi:hypothetical protein
VIKLALVAGAAAVVAFLDVGQADAYTCSSACNQIRRACNHAAKATGKIALAVCDEDRDACRVDCELNPETCTAICQAANLTCPEGCVSDPDPAACQAGCATALAECPLECPDCCNYGRVSCREAAKAARQVTRLACDGSRANCWENCDDPIDGACVKGCKSDQHRCQSDWKKVSVACKKACAGGTERRACMRDCRKQLNEKFQGCSQEEIGCVAGCIGVAGSP